MERRTVRALALAAVVGSVCYLVGAVGDAVVPVPDSYLFDPPITSPQFVRDTVLPLLTVAGVASHLGGAVAWRARDRSRYGRLWAAGWWLAAAGLAFATLGLLGFLLNGGGQRGLVVPLLSALSLLVGTALAGVGMLVLGAATVRRPATDRARAVGAAFVVAPVVGVVLLPVDVEGVVGELTMLPYAAAWAALGYALWTAPAPEADAPEPDPE
ncbi:MAG: hypothetical protein ABEJ70_01055 [Halobacteriaceae archaeon]